MCALKRVGTRLWERYSYCCASYEFYQPPNRGGHLLSDGSHIAELVGNTVPRRGNFNAP